MKINRNQKVNESALDQLKNMVKRMRSLMFPRYSALPLTFVRVTEKFDVVHKDDSHFRGLKI
jgi:hypothetical protein